MDSISTSLSSKILIGGGSARLRRLFFTWR
nr:MAG TPA: hypothetical protein [Caudoviricetes sp.]